MIVIFFEKRSFLSFLANVPLIVYMIVAAWSILLRKHKRQEPKEQKATDNKCQKSQVAKKLRKQVTHATKASKNPMRHMLAIFSSINYSILNEASPPVG